MREGRWKNFWQMVKALFAIMIFIGGIILAIYFGLWVMFIKAILTACAAFDAGTLTATLVGWTVIKCLLASAVSSLIVWITTTISAFLCK